jgi:hypothetical protein
MLMPFFNEFQAFEKNPSDYFSDYFFYAAPYLEEDFIFIEDDLFDDIISSMLASLFKRPLD